MTYEYDDNLLEKLNTKEGNTFFTYKDGILIERNYIKPDGSVIKNTYIYENGKVVKMNLIESFLENGVRKEYPFVYNYSYDSKGRLVSINDEKVEYPSDNVIILRKPNTEDYEKYTYSNGNLIKVEKHSVKNGNDVIEEYFDYGYDDKKSTFALLLGPYADPKDIFEEERGKNNLIKQAQYIHLSGSEYQDVTDGNYNFNYEYDSYGRLIKYSNIYVEITFIY